MADSASWPALLGAAIGAGGAVLAQVISAVFTARREATRLTWEQGKQEREWKLRDSDRFLTRKQELYSRYISLTYAPIMDTVQLTRREYATNPDWHELVPEYVGPLGDEIDDLRWNIRLLGSPIVAERVEYSNASVLVAISEAGRPDRTTIERRHELAKMALSAWQQVSDAMRADLRGDELALQRIRDGVFKMRPSRSDETPVSEISRRKRPDSPYPGASPLDPSTASEITEGHDR